MCIHCVVQLCSKGCVHILNVKMNLSVSRPQNKLHVINYAMILRCGWLTANIRVTGEMNESFLIGRKVQGE